MTDEERLTNRRAAEKAYRTKHREKRRLASAAYNATEKGRNSQKLHRETFRETIREKAAAHRATHREQIREREKAYRESHADAIRERHRANKAAKRNEFRAKARARYAKNSEHFAAYRIRHKDAITKTKRAWVCRNTGTMRAIRAKRIAATYRAVPSWANLNDIKAIYEEAARLTDETGIKHEVDHVIPIQSPLVCGLHCEANLQILTKAQNRAKSNHFTPHTTLPESPWR